MIQKSEEWYKVGFYSLLTGTVYGATSTIVGQPLDTIKTKSQAQPDFMGKMNLPSAIQKVWKEEGLIGFYRGSLPTFAGSVIFRSLQFSVFDAVMFRLKDNNKLNKDIPLTFGLQPRVIVAGLASSFVRAIIENPFEYAKVKRQTKQGWKLTEIYKGFPTLYLRTTGLMTTFFIFVDSFKRNTNFLNTTSGNFFMGGFSAVLAWIIIWPLENMKNIIQAETQNVGNTWMEKYRYIIKNYGVIGLYRGMLPGLLGVFFRNGMSMIAMQTAIKKMNDYGLRK